MALWRSMGFLRTLLAVLLAVALLGVSVRECSALMPACKSDCCLPTPGCLALNFDQAPTAAPDAPSVAPSVTFVLLAVLAFVAVSFRFPAFVFVSPLPFRSDPGGRRSPTRAFLRCWTV